MKLKIWNVALVLTFVLFLSGNVLAVDVTDFDLDSEKFISDEPFTASFECSGPDFIGAEINISKGDWWYSPSDLTETPLGDNKTQIAYNINPDGLDGTGIYSYEATCLGSPDDKSVKSFKIFDFQLDIISPTSNQDKTQGDYINTIFSFSKVVGSSTENVENARFNVILSREGQEFVLVNNKEPNKVSGNLELNAIISYVPNNNFYGMNDLIVEYTSESIRDEVSNAINLQKAFEISFEDPYPVQMSGGGSLDVPIFINSPVLQSSDLQSLEFEVMIDDYQESISGGEIKTCSQSGEGLFRCVLPVSVPDNSPGSYELQLTGEYLSHYDTVIKEIYFTIPFTGTLNYASGQIVDATIELQNLETGKWYTTEVNSGTGRYSLELLPGAYDMKITSPDIKKIDIKDVEILESSEMVTANSPMTVDSFTGGQITGIQSVKTVVFEFGLDFDRADLWLQYNDMDVDGSEENLKLYSCHDWNYGKRKCNDDWEQIPFNINMVTNMINFNVTEFSAFILGNKESMSLDITMDRDTYFSTDRITFTGNLVDSSGGPIKNAKIEYGIKDTELTGETYTDDRGHFIAADLLAPSEEGTYVMEITVKKSPYREMTTTNPIRIEKKKDFSVIVPEEIKIGLDQSLQRKISVINTGQKNYDSLTLSVRGISTDWYTMSPMTLSNLTIGEEKIVTMNLKIPSKYCEDECQIYHFVDIIAKSNDGQEKVQSFTLEIDQNSTQAIVADEGFELPSLPTGNVIESVSNPYAAVLILILAGFILLTFVKDRGPSIGGIGKKINPFGGKKKYTLNKRNFRGGKINTPTFFKKGYKSPSKTSPHKSNLRSRRNIPRESVVPVLHQVKKSSKEWGN